MSMRCERYNVGRATDLALFQEGSTKSSTIYRISFSATCENVSGTIEIMYIINRSSVGTTSEHESDTIEIIYDINGSSLGTTSENVRDTIEILRDQAWVRHRM
jgi:hypothetical protein